MIILYTLSGRLGKMVASHAEGCKIESLLWLSCIDLFMLCTRRSGDTANEGGGATGKFDLPSLTPSSEAGCGRLKEFPIGLLQ